MTTYTMFHWKEFNEVMWEIRSSAAQMRGNILLNQVKLIRDNIKKSDEQRMHEDNNLTVAWHVPTLNRELGIPNGRYGRNI